MAYFAISSDQHGALFSIDHNGDLRGNHFASTGDSAMRHQGLGIRIGSGWQGIRHLASTRAGDRVVWAAVKTDGTFHSASALASEWPTLTDVAPASALFDPTWPDTRFVFGDDSGSIHLVDSSGGQQSVSFADVTAPFVAPVQAGLIGADDQFADSMTAFRCGDLLFDVTFDGRLRYRSATPAGAEFAAGGWTELERGWNQFQRVLAADATSLYCISSEGDVTRREFTRVGNAVRLVDPNTSKAAAGVVGWGSLRCLVEGYCVPQSVRPGESVSFMVAGRTGAEPVATPANYTADMVKLQRMQGRVEADRDRVASGVFTGVAQPGTLPDDWLQNGAQWPESFEFTVPAGWRSGVYAARCTDEVGNRFFIPFVVRPAARTSDIAVLAHTNTWNAYNSWGGQGKYVKDAVLPRQIPFERPHPGTSPDILPNDTIEHRNDDGSYEIVNQSHHLLRAELWVLGWLDELAVAHGAAYNSDLYTDRDLHDGFDGLDRPDANGRRYKALIISTHAEYWTQEMYDRVKRYQDLGGSIVYLGANGIYELVELDRERGPMRVFTKTDWSRNPTTPDQARKKCRMRDNLMPEHAILGVGYEETDVKVEGEGYFLRQEPRAPGPLAGLPMHRGDALCDAAGQLGNRVNGWETDRRSGVFSPAAAQDPGALVADGQRPADGGEMLFFESGRGGVVFSASSINFGGSLAVDANLQRVVRNVLDICLARTP